MSDAARLVARPNPLPASPLPFGTGTLIELLPTGVYACDAAGVITEFNTRAAEIWGSTPEIGDTDQRFCGAYRLFWPDGTALLHEATPMAEALRTGQSFRDVEVVIERPDGTRVWASVNIDALRDERGAVTGALNCFHDITARKHAESELRRSEAFLAAVVETTPECIKIVAEDGTLLQMNAAGLGMIEAAAPDEAIGASVFDIIAPEHLEEWRRRHGVVCGGERQDWEFEIVGFNGTRRQMETHAVPFVMQDGTVAQLAITRDVTERNRWESALRESRRWLSDLLQALPTAVYTTDAAGRITFFNAAAEELWGRAPEIGEEWCGSFKLYRLDGSPLPHDQCPMAVALKEGREVRGEEALLERPDGTRVPFAPYPSPLRDEDGAVIGAVNMLVDISHLQEARDRQQLLINELNHRVKNSLALVQSIANLTIRHSDTLPAFREAFGRRLTSLSRTHNLLTQSYWTSLPVGALVEAELAPFDAENRIEIGGEEVSLNPRQGVTLALVLHELATNAVKHGALLQPDGRLGVTWRAENRRLRIDWIETCRLPADRPRKEGFGSVLIRRSVEADLRGNLDYLIEDTGLRCSIDIPLRD
jgi:PAS domain S-box-containing protein